MTSHWFPMFAALLGTLQGCDSGDGAPTDVPVATDVADVATPTDTPDAMSPDVPTIDARDATPTDASPDAPDARDVPSDGRAYDAGSYACGTMTCASNQVCVHPCSGIDSGMGGPPPVCVDVPASCDGTPTCECVHPSQCVSGGSPGFPGCTLRGARDLICNLCA
jgi:hypothetical protein